MMVKPLFSLPDDVPGKGEMKLAIANFCAVTNKQSELVTFLNLHDIDILCGTKSHLDETILNSELFPQNLIYFTSISLRGADKIYRIY